MKKEYRAVSAPLISAILTVIFLGTAVTASQAVDLPTIPAFQESPAYVEGEAIVVFRTDPTAPDRAEVNSLGLNFVNATGKTDLTRAVMEERIQARQKKITIEPNIVFDKQSVRNREVNERMARLGQQFATSHAVGEYDEKLVFGVAKSDSLTTDELVKELRENPEVSYAQPNYLYYPTEILAETEEDMAYPNATNYENATSLYGIFNNGNTAGVRADSVWAQGFTGRGVIVANIDTGADIGHSDLQENIWKNPGETNCTDGKDNDNNGYIDDCNGWDFANNDNDPRNPEFSHGTHTSGTIAARRDQSGVVGVAPDAKLMVLRVFAANRTASTTNIVKAIDYAWKNGAQVMNMSFGGPGSVCPAVEHNVIQKAYAAGVFMVASSGNCGENCPSTPSVCQYVLTVGATDSSKNVTSYSSSYKDSVDGVAPGHKILSTIPGDEYEEMSGTSMAAPNVSGIAALMISKNPQIPPLEIADTLCKTAEDIPPAGNDVRSGCGFFSAEKAVAGVSVGIGKGTDCHLITDATKMPAVDNYGVPYNLFSPQKELLMKVSCRANSTEASFGNDSSSVYIYSKGYSYENGKWKESLLSGPKMVSTAWYEGSASAVLTEGATPGATNYLVSFLCTYVNNMWKCGCRDEACTTPHWNLQSYQRAN